MPWGGKDLNKFTSGADDEELVQFRTTWLIANPFLFGSFFFLAGSWMMQVCIPAHIYATKEQYKSDENSTCLPLDVCVCAVVRKVQKQPTGGTSEIQPPMLFHQTRVALGSWRCW